uniref:Ycf15 n=30 Tax=Ilex TaxID=4295 RepID=A0A1B1NH68_9AQUA|nr:Ycf15 [Ilex latifolia]YP_010343060.1 Ycf15 [Ilex cornuta x Ilex latifolia]YP_010571007.1 Ycf15 [Ilex fukienensis]YP_010571098.1 Ycf15 [Ilex venusta]YP_010571280.1 Ycf15 [Ilex zhejiangensis]YP_010969006.1 Ycf15 [Ilex centrochinensis]YP_010969101.1 Ycf15 [Ilex corallina]YP_010969195.1 Ycf15 [Ilex cyrtura]YP_010969288.1 Ycf15 [Ilex dimorphophylla]YP_010969383.1 Ycf15 [Ilex editicostata]YP_010969474.1 Ycf15 [Ilex fragilis]YP_010969566.1 Ycf15 [Ilex hainanensis]YP_010969661.1 Ycf15 [Ilex 
MGTIGSGEFNNRRLLAFQPSFAFQGLPERESSTSWS